MSRHPIETVAKRSRGRPKGTGIDDAKRLASIRAMLAADRDLKPTTAIKRAGVTDPSAVRRLREKLRTEASDNPSEKLRLPAAALATSRPETMTAELPVSPPQPTPAPLPQRHPEQQASISKHPPLAAETEKRTREALLLAAYLEAMIKTAPSTAQPDARPEPAWPEPAQPESARPEPAQPESTRAEPTQANPQPSFSPQPPHTPRPETPRPPQTPRSPETPRTTEPPRPSSQAPFSFPGMPPFLQPFRQPPQQPAAGSSQAQQLEGMKLAVEAMTTMTKLQLHITENAMAYSPLAMMLQGQAMVGQMLLASFTGQLDAMKPKKPDGTKP